MVDPRTFILEQRLKQVRRVIAVSGGKGGVGKSLFSSTLALVLAERGLKVGLFDIDFTSPSTHAILGVRDIRPSEGKAIIPAAVHGLSYMSIVYFSGNRTAPLRGADVSNALIELLSVIEWGRLDCLLLDMPPGISDVTLDLVRLLGRVEFLIVTTPSLLAFETVRKLAELLLSLKMPVIGIVENMKMGPSRAVEGQAKALGLILLGEIPFDEEVEQSIGNTEKLLNTVFAEKVRICASRIEPSGVERTTGRRPGGHEHHFIK